MKKTILIITLMIPCVLFAQLNGPYTIGPTGNYSSFTAAVSALTSSGISGPVVFNIAPGTYNEQIIITAISGSSATNSITFQSANGDSTSVILTYSPTSNSNNYTIKIQGGTNIYFNKITIKSSGTSNWARVFDLKSGTNHISFTNNIIFGQQNNGVNPPMGYSIKSSSGVNNITIINNCFNYSKTAVYLTGNNTTVTQINNNHFYNQSDGAVYLLNNVAPNISNNSFFADSLHITSGTCVCFKCEDCTGKIIIQNNEIIIYKASGGFKGITLWNCTGISSNKSLIINNFLSFNYVNATCGINLRFSTHVKLLNNSVFFGSYNSPSSQCLHMFHNTSNNYLIKNNILVNNIYGKVINVEGTPSVFESNFNNFISNGIYFAEIYNIGAVTNLAGWKIISQGDSNSVSINPNFYSSTNLHVANPAMDNLGTPLPEVTNDFDGETRDSITPDIGADEFTVPAIDIGATSLINNLSGLCYSSNETLYVKIKNYGFSTIHFVIDTAIIDLSVSGANPFTFPSVILSTDSLQVDSTMDVLITTNYNMSASGSYIFNASATSNGDGNIVNDAMPTYVIDNSSLNIYPYLEDMESYTVGTPGTVANGWATQSSAGFKWYVNNGLTNTLNTGPIIDHTLSTSLGKYIYSEASNGSIGNSTNFISPCINLNSLNNPGLSFWYHMYGSGIGSLNIDVFNGSSWVNNVHSIVGQQQASIMANWLQTCVNLSGFSGIIKLRFRAVRGNNEYGDIALDDIKIGGAPYVNLGPDTNICAGSTITLDAGAGTNLNYTWKKVPSPIIIGTNQTITVNQAGTYYVIVTNQNGLGGTDSITITVNQPPTVNAGVNSSVCTGSTFAILGDTATNYTALQWTTSGTGTFSSNTSFSPTYTPSLADISAASVYLTLSAYGIPPCANDSDSLLLTINPLPVLSINGLASSYCVNAAPVSITGIPSGGTFTGSGITGNTFNSQLANLGTNIITYSYTDGNGCSNSTTLIVTVNPLPIVSFSGLASSYCINSSTANLSGNPTGGTFTGNGISGNTFYPNVAGVGTHSIIYTCPPDANGCSNSDTQSVVVNALPVVSFTGLPTNCCLHDSAFLLYGNPSGGSFSGSGIVQNVFNPFLASTGFHNITYTFTDANSCTNSTSQNITVYPNPIANAGTDKTIVCGGPGTMIGSGTTSGFSYLWSPTNSLNDSTISNPIATPTITTIYTLTITNNTTGCTQTDEVFVILMGPTAFAWPDTTICEGQSVTLFSTGGTTFLWSNNATTSSITVSPTITTEYSVTVTNSGCSAADTVLVTVNPLPLQASIPTGPTDVCMHTLGSYYTTVGATYALTHQWFIKPSNAGQIVNNNLGAIVNWDYFFYGNAKLSVLGVNQCGIGDTSQYLNIDIHHHPIVNLGNDTTICNNKSITLDAGNVLASYLWSTGDTTQYITVDSIMGSGTYSVIVTDSFNCVNSDNIIITFDPCAGLAEWSKEQDIKIYPNPTKGIFTIETSGIKNYINVSVFSIQGKEIIKEYFFSDNKIKLDLSNHPKGVYFIKLWNNDFVGVEKIVVQ